MKAAQVNTSSEEWLRILDKGMLTIPKSWREELGFSKGEIVKAQKVGNRVIIESQQEQVPYRVYSAQEISGFVKNDRLPQALKKKIAQKLESS